MPELNFVQKAEAF